jgi:hypothetical protein
MISFPEDKYHWNGGRVSFLSISDDVGILDRFHKIARRKFLLLVTSGLGPRSNKHARFFSAPKYFSRKPTI